MTETGTGRPEETNPTAAGVGVAQSPGISIRDLTLRVTDRTLLEGANADFPAQSVTLVVGPSGTGKSLLLNLLAGLATPSQGAVRATGSINIEGVEVLAHTRGARPPTGIIFQDFALFDELTARENLRFAEDHRQRRATTADPSSRPAQLLEEFGLPGDRSISSFSGGEKQRLAIARTLAYDPAVILYDEPTSGLDPSNARRVAERIRRTANEHRKTTVVITHDYTHLAPIADTVYLLDASQQQLSRVESDQMAAAALSTAPVESAPPADKRSPSRSRSVLLPARNFLESTGSWLTAGVESVLHLAPFWRSYRWGLRYLRHYLGLVASPSAWLYFGAAGVIAGFVSTHFVFKFLPQKKYTEPLFSDEVLNGLGFALFRILVPVLLTVLLAARCGAAVASDVGNRLQTQQLDAMRSLGAPPSRYLLTPILYAFLLATPFLVGIGFLAARTTSLIVFTYSYPEHGAAFWDVHFHRNLVVPGQLLYDGSFWLLAKILLCGVGVGAIAYRVGMRPKTSAVAVSRDVTATIITSTLYVLVVHFVFAFAEY